VRDSTPKKQLDLKEFLSTSAKKGPFGRKFPSTKPRTQPAEAAPRTKQDETKS